MGIHYGSLLGDRAAVEELDCRGISRSCGGDLSSSHQGTVCSPHVETTETDQRTFHCAPDCRAMAHSGHVAQSAVFCLDASQRAGGVSRVSVVLFHQRTVAAISEPALSAGLQHGAAALFLAASFSVAVSVERLFSRDRQALFQTG